MRRTRLESQVFPFSFFFLTVIYRFTMRTIAKHYDNASHDDDNPSTNQDIKTLVLIKLLNSQDLLNFQCPDNAVPNLYPILSIAGMRMVISKCTASIL